jgi:hypothetical protein
MLQHFKKLFAATGKDRTRECQARPMLEALESRDLLSSGPGLLAHGFHLGPQAAFSPAASQSADSGTLHALGNTGSTQHLTATLSGASGASGQFKFTSNTSSGQNTFALTVAGLTANQTYAVQVGGTTVGQVATNASGNGSVTLNNLTATIAAGSVVSVVDTSTTPSTTVLTGTLAASGGCHAGQRLSASLIGTTGSGFATYSSAENSLRVSVSGLATGATYTLQVSNGTATPTTVGQITTDTNGNGKLSASNLSATIATGTTISVVDSSGTTVLSGTFSTANNGASYLVARRR